MPKKLSTNPKAEEARQKEKEKKQQKKYDEEKQKEDQKWVDNDKQLLKKQQKQKQQDMKQEELQKQKEENKRLYDEEQIQFSNNKKNQAQISKKEILQKQQETFLKAYQKKFGQVDIEKMNIDSDDDEYQELLQQNIEQINIQENQNIQEKKEGIIQEKQLDKHPEKRMKAAYLEYVEAQLILLKVDYPKHRRSQLLQIIYKNWQKSPENPKNQEYLNYDQKKE